ncbi:FecR family protein [Marinirhabdus gelatinilytica]|uniref:FecR family protein n=1 Tax=Marinirhabdus gelatinilytica TaxID=1703343 RepID=A0A370QLU4_9FLAO|nr:FecR domain-containing protein [Marinirhabdus gelatinilytica]RDK89312.1 FecR family protein [Marinirhabdus gelatinilytica]
MDTQLLDKWLNGTHTAQDLEKLKTYPEFAAYQKIDTYAKQIETPSFNTEEGLRDLKQRLKTSQKTSPKVRTLPTLLKIAAVLLVVAASYVFINSLPTTTSTQLAETKTIVLPDASEVVLNSASEISYNDNNWEDSRELALSGEAYFKVAKGKKFTVSTSQGDVTVLGTQFNVLEDGAYFKVACFEGKVAVTHNDQSVTLTKGKSVVLKDGELQLALVFTNKPTWIDNESSYNDIAIGNVLQDLESTYNIPVETQNIDVTLRFTGSYTHNNLEAALQTITIPLGLTYTIENETITIKPKDVTE